MNLRSSTCGVSSGSFDRFAGRQSSTLISTTWISSSGAFSGVLALKDCFLGFLGVRGGAGGSGTCFARLADGSCFDSPSSWFLPSWPHASCSQASSLGFILDTSMDACEGSSLWGLCFAAFIPSRMFRDMFSHSALALSMDWYSGGLSAGFFPCCSISRSALSIASTDLSS